jgi:exodeoxyribonuclease VII small subunit
MPRKEASFEQLFDELEKTVEQLEAGNLTLDESLALYERGMELAKQCGDRLDRAELRIRELAPTRRDQLALDEFDDLDEKDDLTEERDE